MNAEEQVREKYADIMRSRAERKQITLAELAEAGARLNVVAQAAGDDLVKRQIEQGLRELAPVEGSLVDRIRFLEKEVAALKAEHSRQEAEKLRAEGASDADIAATKKLLGGKIEEGILIWGDAAHVKLASVATE